MQLNSALSSEIIEINIGGQSIIQVQYGILCLFPDSAFARMIHRNCSDESNTKNNLGNDFGILKDKEGRILFDHDPSLIECIINYLRLKRIHTQASSRSGSAPPPLPPPKPPEGKREEFDILLHSFDLTRYFYPTTENNDKEKPMKATEATQTPKLQASKIDQAKKSASEGGSFSVPNTITVSEEGKEEDKKGEECAGFCSNLADLYPDSSDDDYDNGDDDDDAITIPISIASNCDSTGLEEVVQEETAGTKRVNRFKDSGLPVTKMMRRSNDNQSRPTNHTQKKANKDSEHRTSTYVRNTTTVEANSLTSHENENKGNANNQRKAKNNQPNQTSLKLSPIQSYLEKVQIEKISEAIRKEAPWKFLPGKPVDTTTHCPACGDVFKTNYDKLIYVPSYGCYGGKTDFDSIREHEKTKKCAIWRCYYFPMIADGFDHDADYAFHCVSKWNQAGTDCVKLRVKSFSREHAIETMRYRFAVGRFWLGVRARTSHRPALYHKISNLCKIKTRSTEKYSPENTSQIVKNCLEVLDEVENRCMAFLHHWEFSSRVSSKKMVTQVINDLNLITVNKSHAYRLIAEYEKRCGIVGTTGDREGHEEKKKDKCEETTKSTSKKPKHNGDKNRKLSQQKLPASYLSPRRKFLSHQLQLSDSE